MVWDGIGCYGMRSSLDDSHEREGGRMSRLSYIEINSRMRWDGTCRDGQD